MNSDTFRATGEVLHMNMYKKILKKKKRYSNIQAVGILSDAYGCNGGNEGIALLLYNVPDGRRKRIFVTSSVGRK